MQNTFCFNRTYFILLITVIILIFIYQFITIQKSQTSCIPLPPHAQRERLLSERELTPSQSCPQQTCPKPKCPVWPQVKNINIESQQSSIVTEALSTIPLQPPHSSPPPPTLDIVREYDYSRSFDPLEEPTRRVPRHEIPPIHLKRTIDIPTRGYPDNFTQIGTLVKKGDPNKNENNKILRLFGRQEYPGSNRYEYYTMVNSGHDAIKIPINTKRRYELFDGDIIRIKELKDKYEVNLHRFDAPKYYPDIIY